jgi:hypothetical protein
MPTDPTAFAQHFGFPALLVVLLLAAQQLRDRTRDKAHRAQETWYRTTLAKLTAAQSAAIQLHAQQMYDLSSKLEAHTAATLELARELARRPCQNPIPLRPPTTKPPSEKA